MSKANNEQAKRRAEDMNPTAPAPVKKKSKAGQYIGIIMMVLAFVMVPLIFNFSGQEQFTQNMLMTLSMGVIVVMSTIGYLTVSIIVCAVSIVAYVGMLIYRIVGNTGGEFIPVDLLWILLPIMSIVGISLFMTGHSDLVLENALLKKQVEELVTIDTLTGLNNLRSLYMDFQSQVSYAERNNKAISFMIIRLRYPIEMKKLLKDHEYDTVLVQLSKLLQDTVRLEDKVYRIDGDGFGIILTCDKAGTKIVEKRMRSKFEDPKWFEDVSPKHQIRVEVKIGYLQYDKTKYNRDADSFIKSVEEEVEFDI